MLFGLIFKFLCKNKTKYFYFAVVIGSTFSTCLMIFFFFCNFCTRGRTVVMELIIFSAWLEMLYSYSSLVIFLIINVRLY